MNIKRYCAYDKLLKLALQMIEIHSNLVTVNPFEMCYALPVEFSNKRTEELYQLLIHGITCLHHRQREMTVEGKYISEEEDNRTAISLLQQILPLPEFTLCESELILYKIIYEDYQTNSFSSREIIRKRYYKTDTTKRIIKKLKKMGLLEVKGNRYRGYQYKLIE